MSAPTAGLHGRPPGDQCRRQPGMQISWLFPAMRGICSMPAVKTRGSTPAAIVGRAPHRTYRSIFRPTAALPGPRCPISRKPSASLVARPSREVTATPRLLSRDGSAASTELAGRQLRPRQHFGDDLRQHRDLSEQYHRLPLSASPAIARTGIAGLFHR